MIYLRQLPSEIKIEVLKYLDYDSIKEFNSDYLIMKWLKVNGDVRWSSIIYNIILKDCLELSRTNIIEFMFNDHVIKEVLINNDNLSFILGNLVYSVKCGNYTITKAVFDSIKDLEYYKEHAWMYIYCHRDILKDTAIKNNNLEMKEWLCQNGFN